MAGVTPQPVAKNLDAARQATASEDRPTLQELLTNQPFRDAASQAQPVLKGLQSGPVGSLTAQLDPFDGPLSREFATVTISQNGASLSIPGIHPAQPLLVNRITGTLATVSKSGDIQDLDLRQIKSLKPFLDAINSDAALSGENLRALSAKTADTEAASSFLKKYQENIAHFDDPAKTSDATVASMKRDLVQALGLTGKVDLTTVAVLAGISESGAPQVSLVAKYPQPDGTRAADPNAIIGTVYGTPSSPSSQ